MIQIIIEVVMFAFVIFLGIRLFGLLFDTSLTFKGKDKVKK